MVPRMTASTEPTVTLASRKAASLRCRLEKVIVVSFVDNIPLHYVGYRGCIYPCLQSHFRWRDAERESSLIVTRELVPRRKQCIPIVGGARPCGIRQCSYFVTREIGDCCSRHHQPGIVARVVVVAVLEIRTKFPRRRVLPGRCNSYSKETSITVARSRHGPKLSARLRIPRPGSGVQSSVTPTLSVDLSTDIDLASADRCCCLNIDASSAPACPELMWLTLAAFEYTTSCTFPGCVSLLAPDSC